MSFKKFDELRGDLRKRTLYQSEKAKLDFAVALWALMQRNDVSRTDLAEALEKSSPWITKVLRGDCNFTIDTMVKLAAAAGGDLCLHVSDRRSTTRWYESLPAHFPPKCVDWSVPSGAQVIAEKNDHEAEPIAA
jgi:hypothetical protein